MRYLGLNNGLVLSYEAANATPPPPPKIAKLGGERIVHLSTLREKSEEEKESAFLPADICESGMPPRPARLRNR